MPDEPYVLPENRATLVLDEDTGYAGFTFTARLSLSLAAYKEIGRASGGRGVDAFDLPIEQFIKHAAPEWTAVDADGPIPPTAEGMQRFAPDLIGQVIATWMAAVGTAPAPFDASSPVKPNRTMRRSSRGRGRRS